MGTDDRLSWAGRAGRLLLALIPPALAALILVRGQSYDPAYFEPPAGEATGGIRLPSELAGWTLSEVRWFPEESMYEKINGRAQFYQQFGVRGLLAGTWTRDAATWDMYLYVMNSARAAASVFASEQQATAGTAFVATPGQSAAHQGACYLQLVAGVADACPDDVAELVGVLVNEHLAALGGAEPEGAPGQPVLPVDGQVAGSAGVAAQDAFGYTALSGVAYADYTVDAATATWFVAAGGGAALARYTNELVSYGAEPMFALPDATGGAMFGSWELAGTRGDSVVGVRGAVSKEALLAHWAAFKAALEVSP